jgi:hypothetical protein
VALVTPDGHVKSVPAVPHFTEAGVEPPPLSNLPPPETAVKVMPRPVMSVPKVRGLPKASVTE